MNLKDVKNDVKTGNFPLNTFSPLSKSHSDFPVCNTESAYLGTCRNKQIGLTKNQFSIKH